MALFCMIGLSHSLNDWHGHSRKNVKTAEIFLMLELPSKKKILAKKKRLTFSASRKLKNQMLSVTSSFAHIQWNRPKKICYKQIYKSKSVYNARENDSHCHMPTKNLFECHPKNWFHCRGENCIGRYFKTNKWYVLP